MYAAVPRMIPASVACIDRVGEFAASHGLLASAIVDFTMVKTLDPAAAKDMDGRIARLDEGIAGELLQDAQDLLDGDNPNAALRVLGLAGSV